MKKALTHLALLFIFASLANAQAPEGINYQAVVRDASGQPLAASTKVSLKFTIHDGSASGSPVFTEIDSARTNQFGLVTLVIGNVSSLTAVNWGSGAKFLQVELDPSGGSNFTDMGTSQMMSVPYALFSGNAINGATGATGSQGPTGNSGQPGFL
jgi:hypothetical protein